MATALTAIGTSYLTPIAPTLGNALQLTTDPDGVVDEWPARKSIQAGIGGSSTTQDFGRYAIDCRRTLTWSGNGQMLDRDAVVQLDAWLADPGGTFRYQDGEDNDWTVEIMALAPERIFGMPRHYKCRLELHVLSMLMLRGDPYLGP
jgi:hypothetical protein